MARKLHTSLVLTGTLEAIGPLHTGGAREGIEVDIPLARNGFGRHYLPGTALTGALRAWMESFLDQETIDAWFGYQGPAEDTGSASRVLIEDAPVTLPDGMEPEVWHGVGIDRQWGAAATGIKFSREVLPKGTTFPLELRLDIGEPTEISMAQAALWRLAMTLEAGEIGFGAATSRGLGCVKLQKGWEARARTWNTRQGVLESLGLGSNTQAADQRNTWRASAQRVAIAAPAAVVEVRLTWQPDGPLMSKAPRDGLAVDALPMLSANDDKLAMVLPGSAIKGVLRAQSERIVRTLLNGDAIWSEEGRTRHLEQLAVPLVNEVFGSARPDMRKQGVKLPPGRRGALSVLTCYAITPTVTPSQWATIADAPTGGENEPSPLPTAFQNANLPRFQHAFHVAVDRWTGGAADQLLFDGVEPFGVQWEPIVLRLQLAHLEAKGAAMALLWLLLRDLWEGSLRLGFGVNRGYGAIRVSKIDLTGLDRLHSDCPAETVTLHVDRGQVTDLTPIQDCLECLELAWNAWLAGVKGAES